MPSRQQLSLFVPPPVAADLEAIRRVVDPVQSQLIPAHVTLCREDEFTGLDVATIRARLDRARVGSLTLRFGPPQRLGVYGILLSCVAGAAEFHALRQVVLASATVRTHTAHITLAHPRNPQAPGNDLRHVERLRDGLSITFDAIQLIEQIDGSPWEVLGAAPLVSPTA